MNIYILKEFYVGFGYSIMKNLCLSLIYICIYPFIIANNNIFVQEISPMYNKDRDSLWYNTSFLIGYTNTSQEVKSLLKMNSLLRFLNAFLHKIS